MSPHSGHPEFGGHIEPENGNGCFCHADVLALSPENDGKIGHGIHAVVVVDAAVRRKRDDMDPG